MTKVLVVRNVNDALPAGLQWLCDHGILEDSRNGAVLVSPTPVITEYQRPYERVLFSQLRDANPFFHLMESLWMLAGRNDVAFPAYYAANIASFSDDGVTVAGAYGQRWRSRFGYDQLRLIVDELKSNPQSRRCVLTMWDAYGSDDGCDNTHKSDSFLAMSGGKDVPCNTQAYFDTIGGRLNMTITCRSNDAVWGAYGANAVHFSFLHEYVANCAGLEQGVYRQFSNNFHAYIQRKDTDRLMGRDSTSVAVKDEGVFYTSSAGMSRGPLITTDPDTWNADLAKFFLEWAPGKVMSTDIFVDEFFKYTIIPMANAHHYYKNKEYEYAVEAIDGWESCDWKLAGLQWLRRREERRNDEQS